METSLTVPEAGELNQYESIIERGLKTFWEVGAALMAIRDARLYRAKYATFEDYCRERWGMTNRNASYLISASSVVSNLGRTLPILPLAVSQTVPLASLPPQKQVEVWQNVLNETGGNGITAAKVEAAVKNLTGAPLAHVGHNSGDNEWYTPAEYVDAARRVMGDIDLDPASTTEANTVIKAAHFFTAEEDGLQQEWRGRVWLNPPYAQPLVTLFSEKLIAELAAKRITEAIVLVNNATETRWFQALLGAARAICFPLGRVRFWAVDKISAPLQGQAVLYLGDNVRTFCCEFRAFGVVLTHELCEDAGVWQGR